MIDPYLQPALATPPGVASQFPTTHSDDQKYYYVCVVLTAVVPGVLLLLRLYTKQRIIHKIDAIDCAVTSPVTCSIVANDYKDIIMASFPLFITLLCFGHIAVSYGGGVHQWNVTIYNFMGVVYWTYVVEILYAPTIFLVKAAILLQYLRLFAPQKIMNPFMWYTARVVLVVTGVYYIMSTFFTIFACTPRNAIWDPLVTGATCFDNNALVLVTCLFNIVSDIVILALPTRAVWMLRIPTKRKVGIVLLFAIGVLACVANAMIIYYIFQLAGADADITYNTAWQGLWAFAEISLGITVTCTFSLPKFIEAKGTFLRGVLSSLTRPFTSLTSGGSLGTKFQSRNDADTLRGTGPDAVTLPGNSESDLPLANRGQGIERYPSLEGIHGSTKFTNATAVDFREAV